MEEAEAQRFGGDVHTAESSVRIQDSQDLLQLSVEDAIILLTEHICTNKDKNSIDRIILSMLFFD